MIQINLVPLEERESQPRVGVALPGGSFWIPLVLALAILVPLVGVGAMQQLKIAGLKADISRAEEESRRLRPQIERIQAIEKSRAEIQQRLITVQGLVRDRYLPVQVMDELAVQTPDHLWLTKFSQTATGELELEGLTFSNLLVAELMNRMEESDVFEGVSLSTAEREKLGDNKLVRFILTTKIKP